MTDDKPEPTVIERATGALDEFMATVLRHIRTGQGSPLEELGLQKAAEELRNWRPDIPERALSLDKPDRAGDRPLRLAGACRC